MVEKNNATQPPNMDGVATNESPSSSMEVIDAMGDMTSMPVRLFRAAVAGLAISGIGYYALASSPELNKSFSQLTGLSVIDPVAASTGCPSTCGPFPENECKGKSCTSEPFAEDGMSVSMDSSEVACCANGTMMGPPSDTFFPVMTGECCAAGADDCAGSCPLTNSLGESVAPETATATAEAVSVVPFVDDAATVTEATVTEASVAESLK